VANLSPATVERYAARIRRAVLDEVPAYSSLLPGVESTWVERMTVIAYFSAIARGKLPDRDEMEAFEAVGRLRYSQGFPMESILHAWRVGVRVLWDCLLEEMPDVDLADVGRLSLAFADHMSAAHTRAFLTARRDDNSGREEASQLFLNRLVAGEYSGNEAAIREATALELDLSGPQVAVLGFRAYLPGPVSAERNLHLTRLQNLVRDVVERCPVAVTRGGVLVAVPLTERPRLLPVVARRILEDRNGRVAVGTPHPDPLGLATSYAEAMRAQVLGPIFQPSERIHDYGDLRLFDLFKEGKHVSLFVNETLDPLIRHDATHRTNLLGTLNGLFSSGMSRKRAARMLSIHPNTLDYRLRQAEELLGRSIWDGEVLFRLQLALRLLPLSAAPGDRAPLDGSTLPVAPVELAQA
jgi:hypothetical protein